MRSTSALLAIAALAGCEAEAPREAVGAAGAIAIVDFDDGTRVRVVELPTDPIAVDAPFSIGLEVEAHAPVELELVAWPPRTGGRELALGSAVTADDARRPLDPRTLVVPLPAGLGRVDAELALRPPWHPTDVLISLQPVHGDRRAQAIAGPRSRDGLGWLATLAVDPPPTAAVAARADTPVVIDGVLDEPVWSRALALDLVESLGGEPLGLASSVRFAWDDTALYAAAVFTDEDVWSDFRDHDDALWKQEAFELFVFGRGVAGRYLELQVSPRSVTFDASFARHRQGDEGYDGRWQAAARVDGDLDRRDRPDRGWTAELALPWDELCAHTDAGCPPRAHDVLRINAFRLERPRRGPAIAGALSPTRVPDFHAAGNAATLELAP